MSEREERFKAAVKIAQEEVDVSTECIRQCEVLMERAIEDRNAAVGKLGKLVDDFHRPARDKGK